MPAIEISSTWQSLPSRSEADRECRVIAYIARLVPSLQKSTSLQGFPNPLMGGSIWLHPSRWYRSHAYRKCHLVTRYGLSSTVRPRNSRDGGDCPVLQASLLIGEKAQMLMTKLICSRRPSSFEIMATLEASSTACLCPHSSKPGWHSHQGVGTAAISLTSNTETQFAHLEWLQRQQKPHEVY